MSTSSAPAEAAPAGPIGFGLNIVVSGWSSTWKVQICHNESVAFKRLIVLNATTPEGEAVSFKMIITQDWSTSPQD